MGTHIVLTKVNGQHVAFRVSAIGLLVSRQRGCMVWDVDIKTCIRVRETCSQVLQAIQNARTIIPS